MASSVCGFCLDAAREPPRSEGVVELERIAARTNQRALDHVLELADVARPGVFLQRLHHRRLDPLDPAVQCPLPPFDEAPDEPRNVLPAQPQRWQA